MRHSRDVRDKYLITDQIYCIVVGIYLSMLLWGALGAAADCMCAAQCNALPIMQLVFISPSAGTAGEGHAGRAGGTLRCAEDRWGRIACLKADACGEPRPGSETHYHVLSQLGEEPEPDELYLQPGEVPNDS